MAINLDRNNTSFSLRVKEFINSIEDKSEYAFLKYYQNVIREYFKVMASKGLFVKVEMGLGKTMVAVAIAIDRIKESECIVICAKSLHANMRDSIKQYIRLRTECEPDFYLGQLTATVLEEWIDRNFSFVSLNAGNMSKQMHTAAKKSKDKGSDEAMMLDEVFGQITKLPTLNGKTLIFDEAHDFFRAITNGSKNANDAVKLFNASPDARALFLTGSGMASDVFELVPCFNMLAGSSVLPEEYKDFYRLFVDEEKSEIKNKEYFQNRIMGLTSAVTRCTQFGSGLGRKIEIKTAEFPDALAPEIVKIPMDPEQRNQYYVARGDESDESLNTGGPFDNKYADLGPPSNPNVKPKNNKSSTYRVKSRQLCNVAIRGEDKYNRRDIETEPIENIISPKLDYIIKETEKNLGQLALMYTQFRGPGGIEAARRKFKAAGWEEVMPPKTGGGGAYSSATDINEYIAMLDSLALKKGGAVTEYITAPRPPGPVRYAFIAGDVSVEDRAAIVNMMNTVENAHGGTIDLLIITKTGAQGLDLKRIRIIYITEANWKMQLTKQIQFRGVRSDSHIDLPPEEKNVRTIILLAVDESTGAPTTDEELWETSIREQKLMDSFNEAIDETSIECGANNADSASKCHMCAPTDRPLFTDDVFADVLAPNPCKPIKESTVKAKSITHNGVKYFYTVVPLTESIYGITLYEAPTKVGNTPRRVPDSDPLVEEIAKLVGAVPNI